MLIISRKKLEKIMIGDDIELVVIDTGRSRVRLGIKAPKSVSIHSVTLPAAAEALAPASPRSAQEDLSDLSDADQTSQVAALAGSRRF